MNNLDTDVLFELKDSLFKETTIFKLILARFQKKLPSDKFFQACQGVKRNLRILGSKDLPLPDSANNEPDTDINKWLDYGEVAAKNCDSCLLALGWCQQKLRVGHVLQSYTLALGLLSSIYSLCKALTWKLACLCASTKRRRKDLTSESLKEFDELLQRRLKLERLPVVDEMEEESKSEELYVLPCNGNAEDLGEVVFIQEIRKRPNEVEIQSIPNRRTDTLTSRWHSEDEIQTKRKKFQDDLLSAKNAKQLRNIYKSICDDSQLNEKQTTAILGILDETKLQCLELMNRKKQLVNESAQTIIRIMHSEKETSEKSLSNEFKKELKKRFLACKNLENLQQTWRTMYNVNNRIAKRIDTIIKRGLKREQPETKRKEFRATVLKMMRLLSSQS